MDVPAVLSQDARDLVDRPVLAALTTLRPGGQPHTTPVWIARDGDVLLVNTASGRVKARNVEGDPRVSVCIVDPDDDQHVLSVEGTVVELTREGADELIDALSFKYTGNPTFGAHQAGRHRLTLRIRCDRIVLG
jgi:PPOX class probable F420-dependent enzyme